MTKVRINTIKMVMVMVSIFFIIGCGGSDDAPSITIDPVPDEKRAYVIDKAELYQSGYQYTGKLYGTDSYGYEYESTMIGKTSRIQYEGITAIVLNEYFYIYSSDTGFEDTVISENIMNADTLSPIKMESDGISFIAVTTHNLPYEAEVGDFGQWHSYVDQDGNTLEGAWRLDEDPNSNDALFVRTLTHKDKDGNVLQTSTSTFTINYNGDFKHFKQRSTVGDFYLTIEGDISEN